MNQVEQLEVCVVVGFWVSLRVIGLQATRGNPRGSAAGDNPVAALLPDLPSRHTEVAAYTLLAAPGWTQGGPHERLDWLLLEGSKGRMLA